MPSDRRFVLIHVDDPRVTHLEVVPWRGEPGQHSRPTRMDTVPVPPDDQLAREIEAACNDMEDRAHNLRMDSDRLGELSPLRRRMQAEADTLERRMEYLRAAFHLDDGPGLDDVLAHGRARFGLGEGSET